MRQAAEVLWRAQAPGAGGCHAAPELPAVPEAAGQGAAPRWTLHAGQPCQTLPGLFLPHKFASVATWRVQVGVGLTYLSGTDDILAGMVAQRSFFLGPPRSPLELKVKAHADYNTQTQQVCCLKEPSLLVLACYPHT